MAIRLTGRQFSATRLTAARLVSAVLVFCCAGPAPAARLKTEHYDVYVEHLDAGDVGRLLEAAHARLTEFFGGAPNRRLKMEIYADSRSFHRALRHDRQSVRGGGGYYSPATGKAYLFVQPSAYFTRQVILHEAAHQFHFLVAAGNRRPGAFWYYEGLAEYFGMHNWDGTRLRIGAVPAVSLEDYPGKALRNFDAMGRDLKAMIAGRAACERPESWALVHFLIDNYPAGFRRLAARLDARQPPLASFEKTVGPVTPDLIRRFRRWMLDHQQPWQEVWRAWQQRGRALEGRSSATAVLLARKTPERLAVELEPLSGDWRAGITFGFRSTRDFYLFFVTSGDRVHVLRRQDNQWHWIAKCDLPPARGRRRVSVTRTPGGYRLAADGRVVLSVEADRGRRGLSLDGCGVRFHVKRE